MLAAAVLGLVLPSLEYGGKYGLIWTISGIFVGAICLNFIDKLVPHLHKLTGVDLEKEIISKMEINSARKYRRNENGIMVKDE